MLPEPYNNNYQIVQTPGYRRHHGRNGARCSRHSAGWPSASAVQRPPVDRRFARPLGRQHTGGRHHQFHTTRPFGFARRTTDQNLHLTERFTRTGADTIIYRVTVDDPATIYTKPWTIETTMSKRAGARFTNTPATKGIMECSGILAGRTGWQEKNRRPAKAK